MAFGGTKVTRTRAPLCPNTYVMYSVESVSGVASLGGVADREEEEEEEAAGVLPLFPRGGVILLGDFDCPRRGVVSLSAASYPKSSYSISSESGADPQWATKLLKGGTVNG